ncbi:hypothetical protein [Xanthomarina sp. F2636L]|uniref:hypothetical protein n=1 Tax=Xanthomarina sp. F2636L TaxID=2996018 RepID=UPI00225E61EE|nr:hypothetical protein [Xanthomarina sp. F2636L]MCX7550166.1 hypothetical protein [Xanthomarina sp. F2636L]
MNKNKLHNINQSGFKTPEDYFSNLEDVIMSQIHLDEKINKSAFKTPDNYFESLEERMVNQISEKQETNVISIVTKRNIIAITSVAAAILLLFNLNIFNNNISFESIENEALENYVSNQEFETLNMGAEIIDDIDISSFILEESISDASLENYLYNTSDLEDFISE